MVTYLQRVLVVVCSAALWQMSASGQVPGAAIPTFPEPPFDGPSFLKLPLAERGPANRLITAAASPSVQKELKVSAAVAEKLASLPDEFRRLALDRYKAAGLDASKQVFTGADDRKIREIQTALLAQTLRTLEQSLTADEFSRLKQIRVQWYGTNALRLPDVAAALELTVDQRRRIDDVFQSSLRQAFVGLPKKGEKAAAPKERPPAGQRIQARDAAMLAVLTPEQQSKFQGLQRPPFDVSELNREELKAAGMLRASLPADSKN